MKNKTHNFKTAILPILGAITIAVTATISPNVQADTWKTLPGSSCQAANPGSLAHGQIMRRDDYIKHYDQGGSTGTEIYCPLKLDDNVVQTIGVFVDYSKADDMGCTLFSTHWDGSAWVSENLPAFTHGNGKYVYGTITTGFWWSAHVVCDLAHHDEVNSINYKSL